MNDFIKKNYEPREVRHRKSPADIFSRRGKGILGQPGVLFSHNHVNHHGQRYHHGRQQNAESAHIRRCSASTSEDGNGGGRYGSDGRIGRHKCAYRRIEYPDELEHGSDDKPRSYIAKHPTRNRSSDNGLGNHELPCGSPVEPYNSPNKGHPDNGKDYMKIEDNHVREREF